MDFSVLQMPYENTRSREIQETHFDYDSKSSLSYDTNYNHNNNRIWIYFYNYLLLNRIHLIVSNLCAYMTTNPLFNRYYN
jgi:hypothetical protein